MSNITTTQEILDKVANRLKLPPSKVKLVYDSILEHLKYLVEKTDATAINLPYVGILHLRVAKAIRRRAKKNKKKRDTSILDSKINKIESFVEYQNKESKNFIVNRHYQKDKITMKYYKGDKSIQEIEEIQNEKNK